MLLPCFALVSCKDPKFDKVKLRTDSQAVELKITGAAAPLRPDPNNWIFTIWKFSMVIDGPEVTNVVGVTATNKKDSYTGTVGYEEGKCTILWEAPKSDFAFTASFNVVLSYSDGSKMQIAYKHSPTALGVATGIAVAAAWQGLVGMLLAALF